MCLDYIKIVIGLIECKFYKPGSDEHYSSFRRKHKCADMVEGTAAMLAYGLELYNDPRFSRTNKLERDEEKSAIERFTELFD